MLLYCIVLIILIFINSSGQQHLALLRFCVGGGGAGTLVGGLLPGLQQEEPSPQDLGPSPVSTTQYGILQYSTVLPYFQFNNK